MKTMKKFDARKVQELLASLKNRLADLTEDKNVMLSTCEFDCAEDEWEYDCICEEILETRQAIDKLYDIVYSENTIIVGDDLYYTEDDVTYDIFS